MPRAAVLSSGLCRFSCVFAVEVFCCVCFGCCGGGCGLASGVVALSAVLRCCVASVAVVVRGRCLPVVAFLCGAGVVGSSVACRWSSLPVGGSSFRGVVVALAGVGLSSLLLGACRSVPLGVVGCVAGGRVACAPSCCCALSLRRGSGWGVLWGVLFFMRRFCKTKHFRNTKLTIAAR